MNEVTSRLLQALKALEECVSGMDQSTLDPDFDKALAEARAAIEAAEKTEDQ